MKRICGLLLAGLMMTSVVYAEPANDPAAVTKAAYQVDLKHFGFDDATLRADKPYLTPELYAKLLKKANQPVAKGDAPDIEGDVLFDAQDVPDKYEVGRPLTYLHSGTAVVPVSLWWGSERRNFMVHLALIDSTWKIAEIDYGKDGKLSDLLK